MKVIIKRYVYYKNSKHRGNKHGGNRIKGQIDPFMKYMDDVIASLRTSNDFDACRDDLKDLVALRMLEVKSKPIQLDDEKIDELCEIITKYISENLVHFFIHCCLRFYAGTKAHRAEIDTTCSSCTAKDKRKSLRHAQQDCFAFSDHYIGILRNIVQGDDLEIVEYTNKAIRFVADYIYNMQIGVIPRSISEDRYNSVYSFDINVKNFYVRDNNGDYIRKNSKTKFNKLNLKAATELYCQGYKI